MSTSKQALEQTGTGAVATRIAPTGTGRTGALAGAVTGHADGPRRALRRVSTALRWALILAIGGMFLYPLVWLLAAGLGATLVSRQFCPKPFYHAASVRFKTRVLEVCAAEAAKPRQGEGNGRQAQ